MANPLLLRRRAESGVLTRFINEVRAFTSEGNIDSVEACLNKLKDKYADLKLVHAEYLNELSRITDVPPEKVIQLQEEAEQWYSKCTDEYVKCIDAANVLVGKSAVVSPCHKSVVDREVATLLKLPHVNIKVFKGDPREYRQFIKAFDQSIDKSLDDDDEKLVRLSQYVDGIVLTDLRPAFEEGGSSGYARAKQILLRNYGSTNRVYRSIIAELSSNDPVIKPLELRLLASQLISASESLKRIDAFHHVNTQQFIKQIVLRLSPFLANKWRAYAMKTHASIDEYPSFDDLVAFVNERSVNANDPEYGPESFIVPSRRHASHTVVHDDDFDVSPVKGATASTFEIKSGSSPVDMPCIYCKGTHSITSCGEFMSLRPYDRYCWVRERRLCFMCFSHSHMSSRCPNKRVCGVDDCDLYHLPLLHYRRPKLSRESPVNQSTGNSVNDQSTESKSPAATAHSCSVNQCGLSMRVYLPLVTVFTRSGTPLVCLLDSGSTNTLCSPDLPSKLGVKTTKINCDLNTLGSSTTKVTEICDLEIVSSHDNSVHCLRDVMLVSTMPAKVPSGQICLDQYPYLSGIEFVPVNSAHADIIIGQDHAHLLRPLQVFGHPANKPDTPYAIFTKLGYTLAGPARTIDDAKSVSTMFTSVYNHHIRVNNVTPSVKFDETNGINHDMFKLWDIEHSVQDESTSWSVDDENVYKLWESETYLHDGHYYVPIPWKPGKPHFPNNREVAQKRLYCTLARLKKLNLHERYDAEIQNLLDEGHAELVPTSELHRNDNRLWYLPHHAVTKKPGKVRPVFDCAATYEGICLNSECYPGPNLCNKLLDVLLRFRQHAHAIMADVKAMYLNVRIPSHDRDTLRFLWCQQGNIVEYRMRSHLFGALWCASSSTYALRRCLVDFHASVHVSYVVEKSMYVDDLLHSQDDLRMVSHIILGVFHVLRQGGFHLTKFLATDERMLEGIPCQDVCDGFRIISPDSQCKALGIKWQLQPDVFFYVCDVTPSVSTLTRRKVLSFVASMYDPLGLILPVVIVGRMIFQEITKLGLDWDDIVPTVLKDRWDAWRSALSSLHELQFSRAIVPSDAILSSCTLHHFADGSQRAYGAVTYLTCQCQSGAVFCNLIMSRARLTPIKATTIPRIELCAAHLAARSDSIVKQALDIPLQTSCFWSDSQVVLAYIHSNSHRFKTFVANRVSQIHAVSHATQWRYVPSDCNPADVLSRGALPVELPSIWFNGPAFIHEGTTSDEPSSPEVSSDDPELKKVQCHTVTLHYEHPLDRLIAHYSDFRRLVKAVSWWSKLCNKLRYPDTCVSPISVGDIEMAEHLLVSHVQKSHYVNEFDAINKRVSIHPSSDIRQLDPIVVDGLLSVGGRIKHARIISRSKHPAILPKCHRLTRLILTSAHERAHLGTEWVLSSVRAKYWVPGARNILRGIRRKCIICQRLYDRPSSQKMADLPSPRVQVSTVAFETTGTDLFGPIPVVLGRATVRRYGCVFTCLSMRAVHLEILHSLETDSFLNGFIRFCARRGYPKVVYSDCGTNFVGAQSEMISELNKLDKSRLIREARNMSVEWNFTIPTASHSAGVWERIIQSVRRVLLAVMPPCTITDEILSTVFCQVENLVNTRPLTKLSVDIEDERPLTPNHLLLMHSNVLPVWNNFTPSEVLRRKWKLVQNVSKGFWNRWVKQYLPEMQRRTKWETPVKNFTRGDLVLLADESMPRGRWPLGLVLETNVGRDGLVRSVRVKFQGRELTRPVTKLVRLELD